MHKFSFSPIETAIVDSLHHLSKTDFSSKAIAVAFSGGLDSIVLLHALVRCIKSPLADFLYKYHPFSMVDLRDRMYEKYTNFENKLYAFHIHHGLSAQADKWLDFCQEQALQRGFIFAARHVYIADNPDGGTEQAARKARYVALQDLCESYNVQILLSAHHQDDQAETVLLQLIRGAGIAGLAAMPIVSDLIVKDKKLLRPFLYLSRQQLSDYAQMHHLAYIEDESNQDLNYARNALRHDVMPRLAQIRSGCHISMARSAMLIAEANILLNEIAKEDLMIHCTDLNVQSNQLLLKNNYPDRLNCKYLSQLSLPRVRNLLRYWLRCHGLRVPSCARLTEMLKQFLNARSNARSTIYHDGRALSLWREQIWLEPKQLKLNALEQEVIWSGEEFLDLPEWGGKLQFVLTEPEEPGISVMVLHHQKIRIVSRLGGERFRSGPKRPSCRLQHAYQEKNIPPWLRYGPLVYLGDQLIWVAYLGQHYADNEQLIASKRIRLVWCPYITDIGCSSD